MKSNRRVAPSMAQDDLQNRFTFLPKNHYLVQKIRMMTLEARKLELIQRLAVVEDEATLHIIGEVREKIKV